MNFNIVRYLAILLLVIPSSLHSQQASSPRKRVGVALSGGGALGLAHIGVLKYLDEHHIPVDAIAGTSMGGLIGGLYATGHDALHIQEIARQAKWSDLFRARSEEHTSELQSRQYLVCRLLLEKK